MAQKGELKHSMIERLKRRKKRKSEPQPTEAASKANIGGAMAAAMPLWHALYTDAPPWAFNAHGERCVQTLALPAVIAGKIAKLVTLGACAGVQGASPRAQLLGEAIAPFWADIRRHVELAAAMGGAVLKPYVQDGTLRVDVITQDHILPVAWSNTGELTAAIFRSRETRGDITYEKQEYHHMEADGYHIENRAYRLKTGGERGSEIPLTEVPEWAELAPETVITGLSAPLFSYFKMPQVNTVDPRSPLGASVYARATGLIRQADLQLSRILWEYEGAELAIDADITALQHDAQGKISMPQRDKRLFRNTRFQGGDSTGDFYKVFSPEIRDSSLFNGLNQLLRQIELVTGLSCGTLSEPQVMNRTATEIRYSQQDMLSTVRDTQQSLRLATERLLCAMDALATMYHLTPQGKWSTCIFFPDTILGDPDTEKTRELAEIAAGLRHKWEYRMRWFAEDEQTARRQIELLESKEETADDTGNTGGARTDGRAGDADSDPARDRA